MTEISCLPQDTKDFIEFGLIELKKQGRVTFEEFNSVVEELKTPCQIKAKVKRKPSAYNLFIGECIRSRPSGKPVSEAMKGCAMEWKSKKNG